jgi:alanyl-tRNA synthetase
MLAEGVIPSNKDKGYILRRLIRRATAFTFRLDKSFDSEKFQSVAKVIINIYKDNYPELGNNDVLENLGFEIRKFRKTIEDGEKAFEKGEDPFVLFTTYGFPIELTIELAKEKGVLIDKATFDAKFKAHQEISKQGSEQKFKGGLSGTGDIETKYHTATHLLHQGLREVLGETVSQKGSNITTERTRFDFAFERKLTDEEKKKVEDLVNDKIQSKLPVNKVVMKKDEAEKTGAHHFFGEKYPDEVNVYYIGDSLENAFSKEFCGGPHVENTGVLGKFKIVKEEAVSAGVRRIKAVLE